MKTQTVTVGEVVSLHGVFQQMSQMSKMPIKFAIAKNVKILGKIVESFNEEKEELFKSAAVMDAEGNPIFKEGFDQETSVGAFTEYQFTGEQEGEDAFMKKLNELLAVENEVEFASDACDRRVMVSVKSDEGVLEHRESTVQEVLEDPNNEVSGAMVSLLLEYMLD